MRMDNLDIPRAFHKYQAGSLKHQGDAGMQLLSSPEYKAQMCSQLLRSFLQSCHGQQYPPTIMFYNFSEGGNCCLTTTLEEDHNKASTIRTSPSSKCPGPRTHLQKTIFSKLRYPRSHSRYNKVHDFRTRGRQPRIQRSRAQALASMKTVSYPHSTQPPRPIPSPARTVRRARTQAKILVSRIHALSTSMAAAIFPSQDHASQASIPAAGSNQDTATRPSAAMTSLVLRIHKPTIRTSRISETKKGASPSTTSLPQLLTLPQRGEATMPH
eukprot:TRINITY_DN385_c0_g1_i1.p1 TRINITY_DN385_c0_g1~~TRINITY_DN385_c0_g1_i1.p1  ORF type:complete len:270 (-),score=-6.10 TRINITY_DN385_c0_g1_i1:9-818(-)